VEQCGECLVATTILSGNGRTAFHNRDDNDDMHLRGNIGHHLVSVVPGATRTQAEQENGRPGYHLTEEPCFARA